MKTFVRFGKVIKSGIMDVSSLSMLDLTFVIIKGQSSNEFFHGNMKCNLIIAIELFEIILN